MGEHRLFVGGELDLDHPFDAARADDAGHADVEAVDPVFTAQIGGAGKHPALVLQIGFGHLNGGTGGRIEGRAGFQQRHDLAATHAGALNDGVEAFLGRPAHAHQIGKRNAGDGGIADQGHHGVAVAAKHEGGDVLDRNLEFLGQEIAEAGRIQNTRHADDAVVRKPARIAEHHDHGVERIGDADDESAGAVGFYPGADRLHDLGVDADQVVAAHARPAGDAGGDDDHVGALDGAITPRPPDAGVKPFDRGRFGDVERFALRNAADDIEQHDIAQFLQSGQMGQCAADVTGANKRDLVAGHESYSRFNCVLKTAVISADPPFMPFVVPRFGVGGKGKGLFLDFFRTERSKTMTENDAA